jgi:SNF2 family DNA or RNA helicase
MLLEWKPEIVIGDEFHRTKEPTAKRSRAMQALGRTALHRYGLTGTAILKSPMDIFGEWLFLDNGETFGTNFFAFRATYFQDKNAGMPKHIHFPNWQPRLDCIDKLKEVIASKAHTAKKEDVLDLPPLIKNRVWVQLTKEQLKHYRALKEEFVTWLNEQDAVVASTALVKSLRLLQLTSGFLKTDGDEEIDFKSNPKAKALKELLENLGDEKVIVWCCFKRNYTMVKRVCTELGLQFVECHGEISNNKKFENVDLFNNDPRFRVFVGHPGSLGIGINLVAAKYMIYYSRGYSLEHDIQSEARNYRAGSEIHDSVIRYDIVVQNTIDEACLQALDAKQEMGLRLLKDWAMFQAMEELP